jgi:hypothetical protein
MRKINNFAVSLLLTTALFSCNNSSTKDEDNKKQADTSKAVVENKMPADSSKNSMQLSAMFVEFTMGDASHFMFKDGAGKTWDFDENEDTSYRFAVELPKDKTNETNQGWSANKAFLGKWFNLTYVYRNQPAYPDGPMAKVAVITQVKLK